MTDPEEILANIEADIDKTMGLYPKYDVINRQKGELVTEPCFVLKPTTDPLARVAIRAYARAAHDTGYEPLAQDLIGLLYRIEAQLGISQSGFDMPAPPHTFDEARFDLERSLEMDKIYVRQLRQELNDETDLDD